MPRDIHCPSSLDVSATYHKRFRAAGLLFVGVVVANARLWLCSALPPWGLLPFAAVRGSYSVACCWKGVCMTWMTLAEMRFTAWTLPPPPRRYLQEPACPVMLATRVSGVRHYLRYAFCYQPCSAADTFLPACSAFLRLFRAASRLTDNGTATCPSSAFPATPRHILHTLLCAALRERLPLPFPALRAHLPAFRMYFVDILPTSDLVCRYYSLWAKLEPTPVCSTALLFSFSLGRDTYDVPPVRVPAILPVVWALTLMKADRKGGILPAALLVNTVAGMWLNMLKPLDSSAVQDGVRWACHAV
jgi:hypothetical protein